MRAITRQSVVVEEAQMSVLSAVSNAALPLK